MQHLPASVSVEASPASRVAVGGGCRGCWAAGYCAAYSLAGPQPPVACPLEPRAARAAKVVAQ